MIARVALDFYKAVLAALKPTGAAWPTHADASFAHFEGAKAEELTRIHNRAIDLLDEADPRSPRETLTEWENQVGRDACFEKIAGDAARRAFVHARWIAKGGQSRGYFIGLARAIGYDIAIEEFTPFKCDDPCDGAIYHPDAVFVWRVHAPAIAEYWMTSDAPAASAIREWDTGALECLLRKLKPGHTALVFNYG